MNAKDMKEMFLKLPDVKEVVEHGQSVCYEAGEYASFAQQIGLSLSRTAELGGAISKSSARNWMKNKKGRFNNITMLRKGLETMVKEREVTDSSKAQLADFSDMELYLECERRGWDTILKTMRKQH
ncbi:hypothetical protein KKI24_10910 [bacterium]|nr:hypothetical protein [bacterium]